MTTIADSALWAEIIKMAREGTDAPAAFRKARTLGGRDLTKDDNEFAKVYSRIQKQPLFARNMVLTLKRSEFQQAVVDATLGVDVDSDADVDAVMTTLQNFEKGSFMDLLACIDRVRPTNPELADSLLANAKTLYPAVFAEKDKQDAARAAAQTSA